MHAWTSVRSMRVPFMRVARRATLITPVSNLGGITRGRRWVLLMLWERTSVWTDERDRSLSLTDSFDVGIDSDQV